MPQVINTNVASLTAQRNLNTSQTAQSTAIQRLSSGLRINSAKDDAAGLAISDRMNSQIRGMSVAQRNAQDGISLAQTAEGALNSIGNNLSRIRELAVQSANATNSPGDRAALQQEVSQLKAEMSRVAETTSFNGLKILDGSYKDQNYQIGANAGETISVSLGDVRTSSLGAKVISTDAGIAKDHAWTDFNINGVTVKKDGVANGDVTGMIAAINAQSAKTGVTAERAATTNHTVTATNANDLDLTINGVQITATKGADQAADTQAKIDAINAASERSGVRAEAGGAAGEIKLVSDTGADIKLEAAANKGLGATAIDTTIQAGIEFSTKVGGDMTITGGGAANLVADSTKAATLQASNLDISTADGAAQAIKIIDKALAQVNGERAELGAIQNRFDSVVSTLQTNTENLSASKSRIMDTDFASETANLTRAQILQQAGTAMLAQANQLPQNVLSLLR